MVKRFHIRGRSSPEAIARQYSPPITRRQTRRLRCESAERMGTRLALTRVPRPTVVGRFARRHAEARIVIVMDADALIGAPESGTITERTIAIRKRRIAQESRAAVCVDLARVTHESSTPHEGRCGQQKEGERGPDGASVHHEAPGVAQGALRSNAPMHENPSLLTAIRRRSRLHPQSLATLPGVSSRHNSLGVLLLDARTANV